jgi:hypothetical protein
MSVNWNEYRKLLDQQLEEKKQNYEQAKKDLKTARIQMDIVERQIRAFERSVSQKMGD